MGMGKAPIAIENVRGDGNRYWTNGTKWRRNARYDDVDGESWLWVWNEYDYDGHIKEYGDINGVVNSMAKDCFQLCSGAWSNGIEDKLSRLLLSPLERVVLLVLGEHTCQLAFHTYF